MINFSVSNSNFDNFPYIDNLSNNISQFPIGFLDIFLRPPKYLKCSTTVAYYYSFFFFFQTWFQNKRSRTRRSDHNQQRSPPVLDNQHKRSPPESDHHQQRSLPVYTAPVSHGKPRPILTSSPILQQEVSSTSTRGPSTDHKTLRQSTTTGKPGSPAGGGSDSAENGNRKHLTQSVDRHRERSSAKSRIGLPIKPVPISAMSPVWSSSLPWPPSMLPAPWSSGLAWTSMLSGSGHHPSLALASMLPPSLSPSWPAHPPQPSMTYTPMVNTNEGHSFLQPVVGDTGMVHGAPPHSSLNWLSKMWPVAPSILSPNQTDTLTLPQRVALYPPLHTTPGGTTTTSSTGGEETKIHSNPPSDIHHQEASLKPTQEDSDFPINLSTSSNLSRSSGYSSRDSVSPINVCD